MKPPSFPLYVNNWIASQRISEMSPAQEGAYLRLLCYQWNSHDQTLPEDDTKLAILSRLNTDWVTLGAQIKECFHCVQDQPGRIRNERLFACWNEAIAYREKQSQAGKIGMAKRWKGHSKTPIQQGNNGVITALYPKHNSESESESESYSDTEKKSISPSGEIAKQVVKTFKTWTEQELRDSVDANNKDNFFTKQQVDDFVAYWTEPTASGRTRMSLEKTWETRRRMKTAMRLVYEKYDQSNKRKPYVIPGSFDE